MKCVPLMLILTWILTATASAQSDDRSSHTPPVGPPWARDFEQARTQALQSGKPIFLYSTKTY